MHPAGSPGVCQAAGGGWPGHLVPQDLLPGARSVVAFFVPFTRELVRLNRSDPTSAGSGRRPNIETNRLIADVCCTLAAALDSKGVRAAWQQSTHNFDPEALASLWSHKHVAYLCGLGTFGRHQMLITGAGCAGRLGSLVIDTALPETGAALSGATASPPGMFCLAKRCRDCNACIRRCPSGALTKNGLDKQRCYSYLLQVNDHFHDLGLCDVCGKCATGPCALKLPEPEGKE